jgi:hypothetical protein
MARSNAKRTPASRTIAKARAAAPRRTARVRRRARSGMGTGSILALAALVVTGIIVALGVAAVTMDEIPFEDEHVRDFRTRVRALGNSRAAGDAVDWLRRQVASLQSELAQYRRSA